MRTVLVAAIICWGGASLAGQAPHLLRGSVHKTDGQPIQGAAVRVVTMGRSTSSDSAGVFRFVGVPSGHLVIEVRAMGYYPKTLDVDPVPDTVTVVNITMEALPIGAVEVYRVTPRTVPLLTGVVTDSAGVPIVRASVIIPELNRLTTTDSAGRYRFEEVPVPFSVRVVVSGFRPKQTLQVTKSSGAMTFDFVLDPFIEEPFLPAVAPSRHRH